jgi:ribonuclease M5
VRVREIIVVEGLHDKQAVERVVNGDIWVIGGDRIAESFLRELERASKSRGVVVLTDPDGPGERIRQRIARRIPNCKHAFIAKKDAACAGGVGVEHAADEAIREALDSARIQFEPDPEPEFRMEDLLKHGLAGQPNSSALRQRVGETLRIGTGNAKAFLHKLNALGVTRDEWEHAVKHTKEEFNL